MKIFEKIVIVFVAIVSVVMFGTSNITYAVDDEPVVSFENEAPDNETEQMIKELEAQINDLNSELEQLKAEKKIWKINEANLIADLEILYNENEMLVARRGDINDDGEFTVADVVLLARYVAGTIDTIPYKNFN